VAEIIILTVFCGILAGSETEELGVKIERNVPVPMRDGTILRADVYRPDCGGPYPVLVQRTPYGKDRRNFDRFVKAGYIVVCQDSRGRYESEGTYKSYFTPRELTHDAEDGYDTVEWAARVPGSNGKVGTFGTSYGAIFQWRLASLRPPSLCAMSACSIMAHFDNEHGAFRPMFLDFSNVDAPDMRRRAKRPGVHTVIEARALWHQGESEKWLNWLPWLELPREVFEDETEAVRYWLKHQHIDPWRHDETCREIVVPNLDVVGWYDHAHGNMLLYQTMAKEAKSEIARKGSRLTIGPWTHSLGRRYVGDMDFGSNAELNITLLRIRWFDYWLKGVSNGVDKDSPVRIFVMGDNEWRDEESWPLSRAEEKVFYIASDSRANSAGGDGRLIVEKPGSSGSDNYNYDPHTPVPTLGSPQFDVVIRGACDQRPLAERQDILVYQSQPLTERMEITGFPVVELYASTSAPDTDWFVRLIDVYPNGLALDVSQGFVRARYRNGLDKPELIDPGEVVKFLIRMKPMSNAFLPGHRIRLDITSSDFPNYDRHHNTAADQYADSVLAVAGQTVFHGSSRATRIILPWVSNTEQGVGRAKEEDKPQTTPLTYPLHQAVTEGGIEKVKLLISQGININLQDAEGNTPLSCAIRAGKTEVSQSLIVAGADVNAGLTPPLYFAVDVNDISMAQNLISHGANVNPTRFWTPLQQAPYSSSVEMIALLIDKGADMNVGPWTVWQGAIEKGRMDIMELLLQKGLNINAEEEKNGMSVLGFALLVEADDKVIDYLLDRGADLARVKNKSGLTALHVSAMNGYKKIERLGPAIGDGVDEKDGVYEFTALHYAVRFGHKNVTEVLIANGADIKAKDKWGYQPIHWAAHHDRPDVVELLISKGADINAKTSLGQTPLQLAQERRNTKTVELLRKHGAKESPG
jgi:putative CocE/NonD family hydrolase